VPGPKHQKLMSGGEKEEPKDTDWQDADSHMKFIYDFLIGAHSVSRKYGNFNIHSNFIVTFKNVFLSRIMLGFVKCFFFNRRLSWDLWDLFNHE
jgi:hypothetical protein